jgi:hypothetical protein
MTIIPHLEETYTVVFGVDYWKYLFVVYFISVLFFYFCFRRRRVLRLLFLLYDSVSRIISIIAVRA